MWDSGAIVRVDKASNIGFCSTEYKMATIQEGLIQKSKMQPLRSLGVELIKTFDDADEQGICPYCFRLVNL